MKKIIQSWRSSYRNTRLSSRVIAWLLLLTITAALTYNFSWNYSATIIGAIVTFAVIDIWAFRPYFLSAGVIVLSFWAVFILYMATFLKGLAYFYTPNQLGYVELSMYGGAALATILILAGNWYLANGRYWINLLVSFAAYYTSMIFLPILSLNPIYVPFVALTPVAVWIIVRKFWLFRREQVAPISELAASKGEEAFLNNVRKRFPNARIMSEDRVTVVYTKKHILLFLTVSPDDEIVLDAKGITMDGADVTYIMGHLSNKLSAISKAAKVSGRKMFPVVYVTNNKMSRGTTPVSYKSRQKPDVTEGTVFFVNAKDFKRFTEELTAFALPLSPKERARYEKLFASSSTAPTSPENPLSKP